MAGPDITPRPLSAAALGDLSHASDILHLAHHRNKNQHCRATWYRPFSLFRRHINCLVAYYKELAAVPDTYAARHRKKAADRVTQTRIDAELDYLSTILIPQCHSQFSQLVADLRFAVLGLVLLAALSQVSAILGISKGYEQLAEEEIVRVLKQFEMEHWGESRAGECGSKVAKVKVSGAKRRAEDVMEDIGELMSRDVSDPLDSTKSSQVQVDAEIHSETKRVGQVPLVVEKPKIVDSSTTDGKVASLESNRPKKKKRRKEKGDAIDDLFDGL